MKKRFPITGPYKNDCPLCGHHNAILHKSLGYANVPSIYECRDCKVQFTADKTHWTRKEVQ